jgi:hypothetical protein
MEVRWVACLATLFILLISAEQSRTEAGQPLASMLSLSIPAREHTRFILHAYLGHPVFIAERRTMGGRASRLDHGRGRGRNGAVGFAGPGWHWRLVPHATTGAA